MRLLCLSFLIALSSLASAQPPNTSWTRVIHYDDGTIVTSALFDQERGILIAGETWNAPSIDLFIQELDTFGGVHGMNHYGPATADDEGGFLCRAATEGFAIAGTSRDNATRNTRFYLARLSEDRAVMWERFYGESNAQEVNALAPVSDGGFVMGGDHNIPYVVRTDSLGDTLYSRSYPFVSYGVILGIWTSSQGETYATGIAAVSDTNANVFMMKTSAAGNSQFTRTFGGSGEDRANCIVQLRSGDFLLAGGTQSYSHSNGWSALWLRTDSLGDSVWAEVDTTQWFYMVLAAKALRDGGWVTLSEIGSQGNSGFQLALSRWDSSGTRLWTAEYPVGAMWFDRAGFDVLPDGRYFLCANRTLNDIVCIMTEPDPLTISNNRSAYMMPTEFTVRLFPNPFNSTTTISLTVPLSARSITLTTFNLLGQVVRKDRLPAAVGQMVYHYDGAALASGIYLLRAEAGAFSQTTKLVVMK